MKLVQMSRINLMSARVEKTSRERVHVIARRDKKTAIHFSLRFISN